MNLFDLITLQQRNVLTTHMANYTDAHQAPPGWLTGWSKRKAITLTGGISGAQTDYALLLDVPYDSDMLNNFNDLRFTDNDGETLINAWLETKNDGVTADIWVEFPTTPNDSITKDYYMYYGRSAVDNIWNVDDTFLFGDTFPGAVLNGDKWDILIGTPTVNNGLSLNDNERIQTKVWAGNTVAIKCKATCPNETGTTVFASIGLCDNALNPVVEFITYWNWDTRCYDTVCTDKTTIDAFNGEHILEITKTDGTTTTFYVDNVLKDTDVTCVPNVTMPIRFVKKGSNALLIDWVIAHKHVTAPATYVFGSEESA